MTAQVQQRVVQPAVADQNAAVPGSSTTWPRQPRSPSLPDPSSGALGGGGPPRSRGKRGGPRHTSPTVERPAAHPTAGGDGPLDSGVWPALSRRRRGAVVTRADHVREAHWASQVGQRGNTRVGQDVGGGVSREGCAKAPTFRQTTPAARCNILSERAEARFTQERGLPPLHAWRYRVIGHRPRTARLR